MARAQLCQATGQKGSVWYKAIMTLPDSRLTRRAFGAALLLFGLWAAKYSSERSWQEYQVVFTEPVTGLTEGTYSSPAAGPSAAGPRRPPPITRASTGSAPGCSPWPGPPTR